MQPYAHILSPVQVRGKTFKSRLLQSKCALPPRDLKTLPDFYVNTAKNGAAMVTVWIGSYPKKDGPAGHDGPMMGPSLEMSDPATRAAYRALNDRVHALGSLTSASLQDIEPGHVNISDTPNWDEIPAHGDYNSMTYRNKPGITLEGIENMMQDFVSACVDLASLGFDAVTFYMSYRASILCNSLSPVLNQRTDHYGGSTNAERTRLTVELFRRIRAACPDLIIEVQCSGEEEAPGYTTSDWLEYCRAWEGLVDLIQVRGYDGSATHVSGVNMDEHCPPNLRFAEAFKQAGIDMKISPVGGFGDPEDIERFLAEGKTDFVSMARQFICEPHYHEKLLAGAPKADFVPCIRCNDCHGRHRCPAEPLSLLPGQTFPETPARKKRVAVLGGGPAGMLAAITAAKRGHDVTLYEKTDRLGGQLNIAAAPGFKWPLREYRDYLIGQTEKSGVQLHLNTEATPEGLREAGFDAVICALGSSPKRIPVPGADAPGVWLADEAMLSEEKLGHRVVVIGGATTGRETAMHLAEHGHDVTMLTRTQGALFRDFHAQRAEEDRAALNPNFHVVEHCSVREIGAGYLLCDVKRGIPHVKLGFGGACIPGHMSFDLGMDEQWPVAEFDESNAWNEQLRLEFDDVVVSGGRAANSAQAERFAQCAPEVFCVGDAVRPGDIRDGAGDACRIAMEL